MTTSPTAWVHAKYGQQHFKCAKSMCPSLESLYMYRSKVIASILGRLFSLWNSYVTYQTDNLNASHSSDVGHYFPCKWMYLAKWRVDVAWSYWTCTRFNVFITRLSWIVSLLKQEKFGRDHTFTVHTPYWVEISVPMYRYYYYRLAGKQASHVVGGALSIWFAGECLEWLDKSLNANFYSYQNSQFLI